MLTQPAPIAFETGAVRRNTATMRIVVAVACLLGADFLHWNVIDQHAQQWRASGVFFFTLALAEGIAAVLVAVRLRPWVAVAASAISVVPVLVWAWDRTLGLPFGPNSGVRGSIGRSDVLCVVFEVITVIALEPFLWSNRRQPASPRRLDLLTKVVVGATCLYVAGFSYWALFGDVTSTHVHR